MLDNKLSQLIAPYFGMKYLEVDRVVSPDVSWLKNVHTIWNVQIHCVVRVDQNVYIHTLIVTGVMSYEQYRGLLFAVTNLVDGQPKIVCQNSLVPVDLSEMKHLVLPKLQAIDTIQSPVDFGFDSYSFGFKLNTMTLLGYSEIDLDSVDFGLFPHLDALWNDFIEMVDYLADKQDDPLLQKIIRDYKTKDEDVG